MLPPIPSWDAMHPIIVHFPIALLMIVPLLLVLGLLWRKYSRGLFMASFVLMVAGTIGIYAAMATGEAGEERAEKIPAAEVVFEQHEELAETSRTIFTTLTLIFTVMLFAPPLLKRRFRANDQALATNAPTDLDNEGFLIGRKTATLATSAFLLFYLAGIMVLANTAHQGGRLVHEFGVQAAMNSGDTNKSVSAEKAGPSEAKKKEDDDD